MKFEFLEIRKRSEIIPKEHDSAFREDIWTWPSKIFWIVAIPPEAVPSGKERLADQYLGKGLQPFWVRASAEASFIFETLEVLSKPTYQRILFLLPPVIV